MELRWSRAYAGNYQSFCWHSSSSRTELTSSCGAEGLVPMSVLVDGLASCSSQRRWRASTGNCAGTYNAKQDISSSTTLARTSTHISNRDEILHDIDPPSRIILGKDCLGDPIRNLVRELDNLGDIIVAGARLVESSGINGFPSGSVVWPFPVGQHETASSPPSSRSWAGLAAAVDRFGLGSAAWHHLVASGATQFQQFLTVGGKNSRPVL
jgi:hypothetical protein